MHELAIAQKIAIAAEEAAKNNNISRVKLVHLKLGQMAAAHQEQLQFGFDTYAKNERLEGAKLVIEEVKVELHCAECGINYFDERFEDHDFAHAIAHAPFTYQPKICPRCGSANVKVIHGQEMQLTSIEGD